MHDLISELENAKLDLYVQTTDGKSKVYSPFFSVDFIKN